MQNLYFPKEASILDPEKLVDWKRRRGAYSFSSLPAICLVANPRFFPRRSSWLSKKLRGLPLGSFIHQHILYLPYESNGGPHLVSILEECRVLGVKEVFFMGLAGVIGSRPQRQTPYAISKAGSGAGVSSYYHPQEEIYPEPSRFSDLFQEPTSLEFLKCFSLEAPFRETPSLIQQIRSRGFDFVDMETAALYAFSHFHQIPALSILWGADQLYSEWRPPDNLDLLFRSGKALLDQLIPKL